MTATAKFYTGFALALALVVGISAWAGYGAGYHAGATHATSVHRAKAFATP